MESGFGLQEKGEIQENFLLNLAVNMRYDKERYSSDTEEFSHIYAERSSNSDVLPNSNSSAE